MSGQDQFHVEPSYLAGYAGQVSQNAGYFAQISSYMSTNASKTDEMQGLLKEMATACTDLLNWQLNILSRMQTELGDSAAALSQVGTNYTHTETATAAALDKTYPSGDAPQPTGRSGPQ
ncbi:MAG TPA: hypothetical protein VHZ97_15340 [Pseudonocardiaceae bacterium]|nr:hypothetical protein [Pseudonocardiaceae bacterium]